jgi:hypothetical protein
LFWFDVEQDWGMGVLLLFCAGIDRSPIKRQKDQSALFSEVHETSEFAAISRFADCSHWKAGFRGLFVIEVNVSSLIA